MKRILTPILFIACILALSGCSKGDGGSGTPGDRPKYEARESLETAIPEAIRLLEAEDYRGYIKVFFPPEEQLKIDDAEFGKFEETMRGGEAAKLIAKLKAAQERKPVMSDKDTKARYDVVTNGTSSTVKFKKIDEAWFIEN